MIVIGHSQGGLLTKMTVIDSGDRFWRNVSDTPIDQLKMSDDTRALLREATFVEPLPFVSRVVFVATPHRGSYLAGPELVRRLAQKLVSMPSALVQTGTDLFSKDDVKPYLKMQTLPTAIDNMSPSHPFIRAISEIPVAPGVHAHSIIAVDGDGPKENGGDGVVKYVERPHRRRRIGARDQLAALVSVQCRHHRRGAPDSALACRRCLRGRPAPASAPPAPCTHETHPGEGCQARPPGDRHSGPLSVGGAGAVLGAPAIHAVGRWPLAAVGLVAAVAAVLPRLRWWPLALFAAAFVAFLMRWHGVQPSNDRDWQPDVAVLPFATFDGDLVTIHNIRNFDYRTETDYTPHYYDKTYDMRQLDSADLIAVYWMGDAIAHIMVSFGFAEQDFVTVSIETRKEVGETYDTLKGFFRQYELIYIVGDERDLIRLRTNYRKDPPEDAYLYRTNAPPENVRRLFLSYFQKINELKEHPGLLQHADHELHDQRAHAHQGESGQSRLLVEDPAERLRAPVRLRARPIGYQPAVRGAEAALAHQCGGACRGPGRRFLTTHPCWRSARPLTRRTRSGRTVPQLYARGGCAGVGKVWKLADGLAINSWVSGEWMAYRQFDRQTEQFTLKFECTVLLPTLTLRHGSDCESASQIGRLHDHLPDAILVGSPDLD